MFLAISVLLLNLDTNVFYLLKLKLLQNKILLNNKFNPLGAETGIRVDRIAKFYLHDSDFTLCHISTKNLRTFSVTGMFYLQSLAFML